MLQAVATVTVVADREEGPGRASAAVRVANTGGFLRSIPRVGPRRRCQPGFTVRQAEREQVAMRLVMQLEREADGRLCGEITREGAVTPLDFSGTLEMLKVLGRSGFCR
jgi:hypothetical protein